MAGPIPTLTVKANWQLQWNASVTDNILGVRPDNNAVQLLLTFQNLVTATYPANQLKVTQYTIAAGASKTIDLSAASANVLNDTTATLSRVYAAVAWLPTVAQSSTLGSSASSVTIGKAAATPALILGLADGNSAITLNAGEHCGKLSPLYKGYQISGTTKNLLVVNNDASNQANLLLALLGDDRVWPGLDYGTPNGSEYIALLLP